MNSALASASQLLEAQERRGGPPLERFTQETWKFIDQKFPDYGPSWFRELTQQFRIGGAEFDYPVDEREYLGACTLLRPSFALNYFYHGYPFPKLYSQGYFCFAEADDGNMWVFRDDGDDDPRILFIESTSWDGDELTTENGIICSDIRLSLIHI